MEQVVDIVEVSEVGVYLENPVRLRQYHRADVEQARLATEERLVLHPRDDIVHAPGYVEEDRRDGEVPAIRWRIREDERIVRHSKDELKTVRAALVRHTICLRAPRSESACEVRLLVSYSRQ